MTAVMADMHRLVSGRNISPIIFHGRIEPIDSCVLLQLRSAGAETIIRLLRAGKQRKGYYQKKDCS
jgi:hypothetical protein